VTRRQEGTAEFPWFHPPDDHEVGAGDTGCIDERWTRAPAINLDSELARTATGQVHHAPRDLFGDFTEGRGEAPTML